MAKDAFGALQVSTLKLCLQALVTVVCVLLALYIASLLAETLPTITGISTLPPGLLHAEYDNGRLGRF